ncbi:carboxypeptidase-like regulatory domain-containing protein [Chitinophaga pollutisoli]|uniref:Carboxypeptidase-like regulatory domain-containing protein n=1 Tax=Chitinophaga pollutisoli TaxID=3133966 RepID=A0ABZ2YPX3_9BACT
MQHIIASLLFISLAAASCKKDDGENSNGDPKKGYVTGKVRNSAGAPLKGVKILIDHSIFYNSNMSTSTGDDGSYSIKIRTGSWYAFAEHYPVYNGKKYHIYLEPDNSDGFGGEGAVRNFTWKLKGVKEAPLSGYFGGLVTFDNYIGESVPNEADITWTFTPVGPLIDGSAGQTLTLKAEDGWQIKDVPMGRYKVKATYGGNILQLRKWRTEDVFVPELTIDFEPEIAAQCNNCAMLEYRKT